MTRLDVWLAANGLAESREKAQALVMAGRVSVDGRPATKPGSRVREGDSVFVAAAPSLVGRGATKLAGGLDALGVAVAGRVAVDVGASTGGFTQTLLERGASRVYAVDVGRGQLHERIASDPRVLVRDRTNARRLSRAEVAEACDICTVDVSFISATKILPALRAVLAPGADLLVLVKPQFEVGRSQVGRGGIVRDPALHRQALQDVATAAIRLGYGVRGACASPVTGAEGNREFFVHLVHGEPALPGAEVEAMVRRAVVQ